MAISLPSSTAKPYRREPSDFKACFKTAPRMSPTSTPQRSASVSAYNRQRATTQAHHVRDREPVADSTRRGLERFQLLFFAKPRRHTPSITDYFRQSNTRKGTADGEVPSAFSRSAKRDRDRRPDVQEGTAEDCEIDGQPGARERLDEPWRQTYQPK